MTKKVSCQKNKSEVKCTNPDCNKPAQINYHGHTQHGKRRFLCTGCGKTFTGDNIVGRPTILKGRKLTRKEIVQRYTSKNKKVHLQRTKRSKKSVCSASSRSSDLQLTFDVHEVTCESCKRTKKFKDRWF